MADGAARWSMNDFRSNTTRQLLKHQRGRPLKDYVPELRPYFYMMNRWRQLTRPITKRIGKHMWVSSPPFSLLFSPSSNASSCTIDQVNRCFVCCPVFFFKIKHIKLSAKVLTSCNGSRGRHSILSHYQKRIKYPCDPPRQIKKKNLCVLFFLIRFVF